MLILLALACTPALVQLGARVDSGQPVDDSGQPVDDSGQPVDDSGQPVDDSGQPVDDSGQPVDTGEGCAPLSAPALVVVSNAADFVVFQIGGCAVDVAASCADSFAAIYPPSTVDGPTSAEAWIIDWAYQGPDETRCTLTGSTGSAVVRVQVRE